jgi:uncharacterized protein YbjT (DUF2867 family)
MAVLHADIERLLAATGLASTIIRPGMFASNTLHWWAALIRNGGVVRNHRGRLARGCRDGVCAG